MEIVGVSFWLVCIATLIHGNSDTPDLCVMTPLMTPYFTPLLDTPRKARGCSTLSTNPNAPFFARLDSTNHTKPSQDVHVISLTPVSGPSMETQVVRLLVILSGTGNETSDGALDRLVLVLSSDRPVKWLLRTSTEDADNTNDDDDDADDIYMATTPWVLISDGSQAEANFNMNVTYHRWGNKKALHRDVKRKFRGIASYTEVKGANHLELKVGAASKSFVQCDMSAQDDSAVVTASLMVQLKTEGCFHEHYIGDNSVDVYVVELDGGGGSSSKGRNKRVGPKSLVPVTVHLLGEGTRPVPRNVTVVLKSYQPIRWQFGVRRIHGNVVVVSDSEDQVENTSAGGGGYETLEVLPKTLPDNMVDLLLTITSDFGPPILYAKTTHASTLQLVVGNKNKSVVRSGAESQVFAEASGERRRVDDSSFPNRGVMQQQPNIPGAVVVTSGGHDLLSEDPIGQLKAAMVLRCGQHVINVTFPQPLLKALRSPHLSLSDASCVATYNRTHGLLSSQTTSCGYTGHTNGQFTLFSNIVNVKFSGLAESDDEDFEASGDMAENGQIPVTCQYSPRTPSDPQNGTPLQGNKSMLSAHSMYRLEMYRDEALTTKLDFGGGKVPEVLLEETLHVKAYIDTAVLAVQLVMEECWLANTSDYRQQHYASMIRNMCPAALNTKLPPSTERLPYGRFSFKVNKEMGSFSRIYLHCRIGICSLDKEKSKGNLIMCVNPAQYCAGAPLRFFLNQTVSTAQQFSHKGPLRPVARIRHPPPPKPKPSEPTAVQGVAAETTDTGEGGARIIHVGVSIEVTVGIALVSFIVGVLLTGALWCIHIKTDPFRQRNKQLGGSTVGGGAVANLSPHSGCSSANSQAAITT